MKSSCSVPDHRYCDGRLYSDSTLSMESLSLCMKSFSLCMKSGLKYDWFKNVCMKSVDNRSLTKMTLISSSSISL